MEEMNWKNTLKWITIIIEIWFLSIGCISTIIIFHEVYHLHLDGNPTGVCVGSCYAQEKELAPAGIHWSELGEQTKNEERNAWIFGISIAVILWGLFILGNLKD